MSRKKAVITIFVIFDLAAAGAAYYFWKKQNEPIQQNNAGQSSQTRNDNTLSTLSVDQSSNPLDLGQIPGNGIEGAQGMVGNDGKAQSSGLNTDNFKEYEKYKSAKSALFAEITKGNGAEIKANKKVVIIYRTWLTDGTLVDESKKDKDGKYIATEFVYGANNIIQGLQQGMAGMKANGSRMIIVPPGVGYGDKKHNNVPPNSVLIFELALIKT